MAKNKRIIATIDLETDPFEHGLVPEAFLAGYYDEIVGFKYFAGANCVDLLIDFILTLPPRMIYAHNGGKFDFHYMIKYIDEKVKIINARVAEFKIGKHIFRDSYCILPIPLKAFKKDDIEINLLHKSKREKHMPEIINYLRGDCIYLFEIVTKFRERFGNKLTVAGAAINELLKLHPVGMIRENIDSEIRPYYYGGRVEVFKAGKHKGKFKIFDVNSMYPYAMREFLHPINNELITIYDPEIDKTGNIKGENKKSVYFAHILADSKGALPIKTKEGTHYPTGENLEFYACSHEIKTAIKLGMIKVKKCFTAHVFDTVGSFPDFVDKFSKEKIQAKKDKNIAAEIFAKLMLNSSYGKFGTDPTNFYDYIILSNDKLNTDLPDGFELYEKSELCELWRRPALSDKYYNVAVAASITSAARSVLLEAINSCSKNIYYCDTDSVIVDKTIKALKIDDSKLGFWKLECEGDELNIAGKKLYCLNKKGEKVKLASKGAKLTNKDILRICNDEEITWENVAPSFRLGVEPKFIKRKIKRRA